MTKTRFAAITSALLLAIPFVVHGIGAANDTDFPSSAKINLALSVKEDGTGTLEIKNESQRKLSIQALSNRLVLAFLVMDDHGNVLRPMGKAKVDPAAETFILESGASHAHAFKNLDFLTGTGLFGYELEKGTHYRVVAVYRPTGPKGPGFASNECVFEYR